MARSVRLVNSNSGVVKTGYFGFSWTSFFFSGIPAITRGDVGIGIGVLVATIFLGAFSAGLLGIIVNIIWAFVYNKKYTTELLQAGFKIDDNPEVTAAAKSSLNVI
jgi:hypothetical protein